MRIKRTTGPIGDFTGSIAGVLSVFEQMKTDKSAIARSVLPFLLSLVIFCAGCYLCVIFVYPEATKWLPAETAFPARVLRWLLSPIVFFLCVLAFCAYYSFLTFLLSLSLPPLIHHIEVQNGIETHAGFSGTVLLPFKLLRISLIIFLFIVVMFPLNLIPVAGSALFFVVFMILFLIFCGIPFYELVFSRHKYPFKTNLYIYWKYKWRIAGTGAGFIILSIIPFAGFLAHIAATLQVATLYCEKAHHEISSSAE